MAKPKRNRDRTPKSAEKETPSMSTPTETEEAEAQAPSANGDTAKRPKIQTTVLPELGEAYDAKVKASGMTANIYLRKLIADHVGFDLPGSELVPVTRTKYASKEEAEAAKKEKAVAHRQELNAALEFYRKALAEGKV